MRHETLVLQGGSCRRGGWRLTLPSHVLCLIVSCLTALALPATAQSRIRNGLVLGAVGAQIDGDRMAGYHQPGLSTGGTATVMLGNYWNARFEVLYTQKGSRSRTIADSVALIAQNPQSTGFLRYRLNYVQIPLLIEWRPKDRIGIQLGVSADYLLNAKADFGYGQVTPDVKFKQWDIMYQLGVEWEFADRWAVNLRTGYSATGISPDVGNSDQSFGIFTALSRVGYRNSLLGTTLRFYFSDPFPYKDRGGKKAKAPEGGNEGTNDGKDGEPMN